LIFYNEYVCSCLQYRMETNEREADEIAREKTLAHA